MKKVMWVTLLSGLWHSACCQSHGGVDQYYSLLKGKSMSVMPVLYYESKKNWYLECRYNYEAAESFSLYAGRTFKYSRKKIDYSISPIAGIVAGRFCGYSVGFNAEMEGRKFLISSQSQATACRQDRLQNFVYSWSDAGYKLNNVVSAGISVQYTKMHAIHDLLEKGFFVKIDIHKWTVPLYFFNPCRRQKYFVVGINYEWKK